MKKATIPVYIRFGELPKDGKSKVHCGDEILCDEAGISVWEAVKANGRYYPVLPEDANEESVADYFGFLLDSKCKVYLVTGDRIRTLEGHCREPVLENVKIIKDITNYIRTK